MFCSIVDYPIQNPFQALLLSIRFVLISTDCRSAWILSVEFLVIFFCVFFSLLFKKKNVLDDAPVRVTLGDAKMTSIEGIKNGIKKLGLEDHIPLNRREWKQNNH